MASGGFLFSINTESQLSIVDIIYIYIDRYDIDDINEAVLVWAKSLQARRQICRTAFRPCLYGTFGMSSVKTTRSGDAQRSTNSTPKMSFSMIPARVPIVAATRSIASQALSRRLIPTLAISQLPSRRRLAMAGGSHGFRV